MTCSGNMIPQYKRSIQKRANPYYGSRHEDALQFIGLNTVDEFITEEVYIEKSWVCETCKKENCDGQSREKEDEFQRS